MHVNALEDIADCDYHRAVITSARLCKSSRRSPTPLSYSMMWIDRWICTVMPMSQCLGFCCDEKNSWQLSSQGPYGYLNRNTHNLKRDIRQLCLHVWKLYMHSRIRNHFGRKQERTIKRHFKGYSQTSLKYASERRMLWGRLLISCMKEPHSMKDPQTDQNRERHLKNQ